MTIFILTHRRVDALKNLARTLALMLALCLALSPGPVWGSGTDNVYFGVVDDGTIQPPIRKYQPIMADNKILIPHSLLTDAGIGLRSEWSAQQSYLTLSWKEKRVTFEYSGKIAFDSDGQTYETRILRMQGGAYYLLDLEFVCAFFGWSYDVVPSDYGQLVRVKTGVALTHQDNVFIIVRDPALREYYDTYIAPPTPIPPTENPNASGRPTPAPKPTPVPTPTPLPDPPLHVYLTFETADGALDGTVTDILDALEARSAHAAFFLTEDALVRGDPARLRRLAATQTVGLCGGASDMGSPALWREQADRMSDALAAVTFTRTRLTRWPALYELAGKNAATRSEPVRGALADGGYRQWDWTLDATGQPRLNAAALVEWIMKNLPAAKDGPAVLRLAPDERAAEALPLLLDALDNRDRYYVRALNLTDRPINRYGDIR